MTPLKNLIGAATELIASIKSRLALVPEPERNVLIDQLRQMARCAYQLAADLEEMESIKKKGKNALNDYRREKGEAEI